MLELRNLENITDISKFDVITFINKSKRKSKIPHIIEEKLKLKIVKYILKESLNGLK